MDGLRGQDKKKHNLKIISYIPQDINLSLKISERKNFEQQFFRNDSAAV